MIKWQKHLKIYHFCSEKFHAFQIFHTNFKLINFFKNTFIKKNYAVFIAILSLLLN